MASHCAGTGQHDLPPNFKETKEILRRKQSHKMEDVIHLKARL